MHWDAENTYPIFDWLWSSGQLSERDIEQLPNAGFVHVVNLALPTSSPSLPGEAELVTRRGLNYFHIPVVWEAPQRQQLDVFFRLMRAIQNQRTWIHCAKNKRVSAFVYLYRRLQRGESESAARPALDAIWQPDAVWQRFIDDALAAATPTDKK